MNFFNLIWLSDILWFLSPLADDFEEEKEDDLNDNDNENNDDDDDDVIWVRIKMKF